MGSHTRASFLWLKKACKPLMLEETEGTSPKTNEAVFQDNSDKSGFQELKETFGVLQRNFKEFIEVYKVSHGVS